MAGRRDRDHQVGIGRVLPGEDAPHLASGFVHRPFAYPRIRAREVDDLEHAERPLRGLDEPLRMQASVVDPHQLPRLHVADEGRPNDVERTRLRGDDEPVREPPDGERPDPVGIARREHAPLVHEHEAERATELGQDLHRGGLDAAGIRCPIGDHRRHDVRVRRGETRTADPSRELGGVHEVPVVSERDGVRTVGLEDGLGVVPGGRTGGRVPGVPDRQVAVKGRQGRFIEDLADQPQVFVDEDVGSVGYGDPCGFLTSMLLGEQTEVGEAGDLVARCPYAEEPALLFR